MLGDIVGTLVGCPDGEIDGMFVRVNVGNLVGDILGVYVG